MPPRPSLPTPSSASLPSELLTLTFWKRDRGVVCSFYRPAFSKTPSKTAITKNSCPPSIPLLSKIGNANSCHSRTKLDRKPVSCPHNAASVGNPPKLLLLYVGQQLQFRLRDIPAFKKRPWCLRRNRAGLEYRRGRRLLLSSQENSGKKGVGRGTADVPRMNSLCAGEGEVTAICGEMALVIDPYLSSSLCFDFAEACKMFQVTFTMSKVLGAWRAACVP
uniref:Uncharacterized protein n=1 Tax=Knipowitschia caucasica TaxID=637954 RepID=A0AAV2LDQ8_KNICA